MHRLLGFGLIPACRPAAGAATAPSHDPRPRAAPDRLPRPLRPPRPHAPSLRKSEGLSHLQCDRIRRRRAGAATDGDFSGDDDGGVVSYLLSNFASDSFQRPFYIQSRPGPYFRMFLAA